ncbi:hypothetical protein J3F83DRAFT_210736 [Trichoderma novae-zelandiae]
MHEADSCSWHLVLSLLALPVCLGLPFPGPRTEISPKHRACMDVRLVTLRDKLEGEDAQAKKEESDSMLCVCARTSVSFCSSGLARVCGAKLSLLLCNISQGLSTGHSAFGTAGVGDCRFALSPTGLDFAPYPCPIRASRFVPHFRGGVHLLFFYSTICSTLVHVAFTLFFFFLLIFLSSHGSVLGETRAESGKEEQGRGRGR